MFSGKTERPAAEPMRGSGPWETQTRPGTPLKDCRAWDWAWEGFHSGGWSVVLSCLGSATSAVSSEAEPLTLYPLLHKKWQKRSPVFKAESNRDFFSHSPIYGNILRGKCQITPPSTRPDSSCPASQTLCPILAGAKTD